MLPFLITLPLLAGGTAAGSFRVAEVKPHFACSSPSGQANVTQYIEALKLGRFGIIALIQTEFKLPEPAGYGAFGGACVYKNADNAVVLYDESQFQMVQPIGATLTGWSEMPYIVSGSEPKEGDMCLNYPWLVGERAFAGALLRHSATGVEVCVVSGTFPHLLPVGPSFTHAIQSTCEERPILFVVDTNAFPDSLTVEQIGKLPYNWAQWGNCVDPGATGDKTCCNDIKKGWPYPHSKYDRTAICRGGTVTDFKVEPRWYCNSDEEHRFTTATVELPEVVATAPLATATVV